MTICQWSEITKSVPATYSYIQLELLSFFGISCFVFDYSCFYFATNFPHFRRYKETYGKFCIHSVRSLRVCSSVQDRTRLLRKLLARWMGLRYSASVRQFKHRMKLWAFVRKIQWNVTFRMNFHNFLSSSDKFVHTTYICIMQLGWNQLNKLFHKSSEKVAFIRKLLYELEKREKIKKKDLFTQTANIFHLFLWLCYAVM